MEYGWACPPNLISVALSADGVYAPIKTVLISANTLLIPRLHGYTPSQHEFQIKR